MPESKQYREFVYAATVQKIINRLILAKKAESWEDVTEALIQLYAHRDNLLEND